MSITGVRIKDFLVFRGEFAANFGDGKGINIFVGENGTGKTTLLKCFYAATDSVVYKASYYFNSIELVENRDVIATITGIPLEAHHETDNNPAVAVYLSHSEEWSKYDEESQSKIDEVSAYTKGNKSREALEANILAFNNNIKSVYIPEKDLLSNAKGLPESVLYGNAQFTRFEIDVIMKARVLANTPVQPLYQKICEIIGGEPLNDGQSFYIKRPNIEKPIHFSLEASGYRKFALLAMLIRNEQIKQGTALLWDEPENSLNPELMPKLVEILLELAQNGVQVFIATHDYNLVRHFDVRKNKDIPVLYHNLTKQAGNGQISCESYAKYTEMSDNLLERANENLFEAVVLDVMGDDSDE